MDIFRPDMYKRSIYEIDYEQLQKKGIKCILFDLDNTLASFDEVTPDKKLMDFFLYLEDLGIKAIIISNASKKRVEPFKEKCNVDSAFKSYKPFKKKYQKILKMYHLKDIDIACVGDQLLTDIYGANRLGFTSILVNPISNKEKFVTKINRAMEKIILNNFSKKGIFKKGEYYE